LKNYYFVFDTVIANGLEDYPKNECSCGVIAYIAKTMAKKIY